MGDDELVAAVARGDDGALRELVYRHSPWLGARLRAVMPTGDVEDVLQETFVAVWRGARSYRPIRPEGAAAAWLWGIARRQAALFLRRRGPIAPEMPVEAQVDGIDPAEAAAIRVDLDRAVAGLGEPGGMEREVFRLMYEEDCSVAEVAALMGVPEGTVKSRAHRVRRALRQKLEGGAA
ncbi:MAG TPA: RNA polymerase sigma factor [Micromonosporaceae bacterium]|jgi:RNA polymerase sigma-70 factor (ECF subfamily)